ncbi:DUF2294 domain-containing protein [Desulfofundulus thermocisternus]|uniref:DUF2294 domain-containing protein n=1 Tax=Desulfofundulus thermocisternus TaxID=42471 RepID=UPI00217E7F61|nr:DUF2294 domain-containing protein [Desulfofundulus thermocisternus]MCS5695713.1 DUF2294 domain-containing protein [Desulfofundulus thermocisternus]
MLDEQGELKQELIKVYNQVNKELYNIGTRWVRVELAGRYILIVASHRRLPSGRVLNGKMPVIARMFDILLLDEFKEKFKDALTARFKFEIECILKDYDPGSELAGTLIVLRNPV